MEFGICNLSIVPARLHPDDRSEMVTQLIFGDLLVVMDEYRNWRKIRLIADNYEAWIDATQYKQLNEDEFRRLNKLPATLNNSINSLLEIPGGKGVLHLVPGSSLPGIENGHFHLAGQEYVLKGQVIKPEEEQINIIENALLYLNAPYLWGGKTPYGIDCSGLVQMVYKLSGHALLRDASEQSRQGETLNFISEAKPGDLLFFDNEEGEITHVGIYYDDNKIIHASGKVRIDEIDHQGIFNKELKKYTHKLRLIKRIY